MKDADMTEENLRKALSELLKSNRSLTPLHASVMEDETGIRRINLMMVQGAEAEDAE